jgi:hypothetical protein
MTICHRYNFFLINGEQFIAKSCEISREWGMGKGAGSKGDKR